MTVDETRVQEVLCEAWGRLPHAKYDAYITSVRVDDLGAKHGSYSPEDGSITLSSRLFLGRDAWEWMYIDAQGNTPPQSEQYVTRALHTALHEHFHAIGYTLGADSDPEWLALGGWDQTWEDRQSTGRYFERRPGWGDQGGSEWAYRKGTYFCREYSAKSPYEDFADCGTHIALGWHRGMAGGNGRSKMRYVLRHVWGQTERGRLEAVAQQWRSRLRRSLGER